MVAVSLLDPTDLFRPTWWSCSSSGCHCLLVVGMDMGGVCLGIASECRWSDTHAMCVQWGAHVLELYHNYCAACCTGTVLMVFLLFDSACVGALAADGVAYVADGVHVY